MKEAKIKEKKVLEKSRSENVIEDEHTFKILIATDTHIGYKNTDEHRHDDSFRTMEEIFQIYESAEADFLLMGGDIFEKNNPPASVLERAIELFMKYVPGEANHQFELLSDAQKNFSCEGAEVPDTLPVWLNGNFEVAKPIMTIHGNHDNPTGEFDNTVIEYLAELGLISQFGRRTKLSDNRLTVYPVLLQKGRTKIAIYGWGWIGDMRFRSMVNLGQINFQVPEDVDDYFNILVVHQNRVPRSSKTDYYSDTEIPEFIDYVLWGHEHDQKYDWYPGTRMLIDQPGATVVTSLTNHEINQRRIGMLTIRTSKKRECYWRHDKIPLDTSRIFIFRDFVISDFLDLDEPDTKLLKMKIKDLVVSQIADMKQECDLQRAKFRKLAPEMPLLRLRVLQEAKIPKMKISDFINHHEAKEYAINTDIVSYKNPVTKKVKSGVFFGFDEIDASIFSEDQHKILPMIEEILAKREPLEFFNEIAMTKIIQGKLDECEEEASFKGLNEIPARVKELKDFLYCRAEEKLFQAVDNKELEIGETVADCDRDIERFLKNMRLEELKDYKPDELLAQVREKEIQKKNAKIAEKAKSTAAKKSTEISPPKAKRKYVRKK